MRRPGPRGRGSTEGQGRKRPLRARARAPPATWEASRCCAPSARPSRRERRRDLGSSAGGDSPASQRADGPRRGGAGGGAPGAGPRVTWPRPPHVTATPRARAGSPAKPPAWLPLLFPLGLPGCGAWRRGLAGGVQRRGSAESRSGAWWPPRLTVSCLSGNQGRARGRLPLSSRDVLARGGSASHPKGPGARQRLGAPPPRPAAPFPRGTAWDDGPRRRRDSFYSTDMPRIPPYPPVGGQAPE